jgi:hypothetical protein
MVIFFGEGEPRATEDHKRKDISEECDGGAPGTKADGEHLKTGDDCSSEEISYVFACLCLSPVCNLS